MPSEKTEKIPPKFPILERGFVMVPAFFIDELMKLGPHIPATFWVYLVVLWRDINHHPDNTSKKSMRKFHIRAEDASRWTAALHASGMFDVEYGVKQVDEDTGTPSKITYRKNSTFNDWHYFITAFEEQMVADKTKFKDKTGFGIELLLRTIRLRLADGIGPAKWQNTFLTRMGKEGNVRAERVGKVAIYTVARLITATFNNDTDKPEPEFDETTGKLIRKKRDPVWGTPIRIDTAFRRQGCTDTGTGVVPT